MEHSQDKSNEKQPGQLRQAGVTRRSFSSEAECCGWVHEHLPILLPAERHGKFVYPFKSARCQRAVGKIIGQQLWRHLTGG